MSRTDWACVFLIILGIILFLIGANIYNEFVGWLGFFLGVGGIVAWIVLYVYNYLYGRKQPAEAQNP